MNENLGVDWTCDICDLKAHTDSINIKPEDWSTVKITTDSGYSATTTAHLCHGCWPKPTKPQRKIFLNRFLKYIGVIK